ncbi:MAG: hypothetical protein M3Y51_01120 [Actinomycetota bacterium]|nr:hypothetical protein [Actinomycetota bacterium]
MPTRTAEARYEVVCELDLANFDDVRVGHRTAKRAHTELRRLARRDGRIASTRFRRAGRSSVEISVTVAASTSDDAFDHCHAMLRTAVHATGGSTHGWEALCSQIRSSTPTPDGTRRAGAAPSTAPGWTPARVPDVADPGLTRAGTREWGAGRERTDAPGWAGAAATAARRGAIPEWLPPLTRGPERDTVIDLRVD